MTANFPCPYVVDTSSNKRPYGSHSRMSDSQTLYTCPSCPPLSEGQDLAGAIAANPEYVWQGHAEPQEGDIYRMMQSVRTPMDYLLTGGRVPGKGTNTSLASSPVGVMASDGSHPDGATPISATGTGVNQASPMHHCVSDRRGGCTGWKHPHICDGDIR